jgi:thiamine-phosphate diphosphorylase
MDTQQQMARAQLRQVGVCLVTNRAALPPGRTLIEVVRAALAGGLRCVQFRDLELPAAEAETLARAIAALCRAAGALYLLNGRPDLVAKLGATGLHVGRSWCENVTTGVAQARALLPPGALIGASVHSVAEAEATTAAGADYLVVGTIYPTASKPNLARTAGPELIRAVRTVVGIDMLLLGIGGIAAGNLGAVRRAGADGVCVMRAILAAPDPATAVATLLHAWREEGS